MAAVVGLLLLAAITMVTADSQYMAIFPKELRNGMNFQVDMTMFSAPKSTLEVKVAIREQTDLSSALAWDGSQFTISIAAGSKSGSNLIMVPYDVEAGKALYVHITFINLNLPPKYEKVVVTRPMSAIFIQTDKGIYKPGDTVRYRVLNVDEELKPQQEVLTVKIKDANDNMIMSQKSDGSSGVNLALISNNFTISDDPIKGIYKIIAETATGYTEATFKVEEYVLPKFEVKVTLDRGYAVTGPDARISGKVKAIYSYGQLVKGRMVLKLQSSGSNVFPRGISTSTGSSSPGMKEVIVENFGGEHVFDIPVQESLGEPNWAGGMYSVSLSVIAEVTESNTKNMMSDSKSFTMYPAEFAPTLVEPIPMVFSGHANYSFQVKLTNPMGGQLSDWDKKNRVNSNAVSLYKLYYTVNYQPQQSLPVTDSITNVTVAIDATNQYNTIEVWYQYTTVDRNTILSAKVQVKPILYYSGSQRTISVQLVPTENKNERCFRMTPFMAGDQAFYQVVNNYYPEKVTPYTSIDKHCITMTRAHAPQSMIIVYKLVNYVDENKINTTELLTSSVTVDYAWSTEQSVTLEVVPEQVKPGENVDIVLQTTGAAVVGISGVDKSTTFLAEANDITMSKLQKSIEQYRLFSRPQENPFPNPPMLFRGAPLMLEKRAEPPKRKKRCIACWDEYAYMDPKKLLMEAGLTIITDLNIYHKTDFTTDANEEMWMLGALAPEADGAAMSKGDGNAQQPQSEVVTGTPEQPKEEVKVRQDFPETWLWDLEMTDESGAKQITVAVPDTITSWTLNAFAFNNKHGLGVAETKEVTVFQDFFLSMDLPYSVVRGEVFDLNLLVFNYKDTTITVSVELMASPNYTILDLGKRNQTLTIVPGTSSSAIVPLRMDKIGDIPITASAKQTTNTNNMDYVIRELIVKPEGREIRKDTGFKIAMPQKGETEIFFDISQFFNIEGYVPDSLRMYMYVTGDMMGPFIENLETKIQMPFGCGEQNIKTLTPSVFVAKYLKTINRLDSKMQAKVGKVCGSGYRKELIYKHKDGSYSAFGEEANLCQCGAAGQKRGSTWLTAYVLKTFSLVYIDDLTYVSVDTLKESFDYLMNNASSPTCEEQYFIEKGELIHTEMQGGTSSRFGFTAFVLISIMDYKDAAEKAGDFVSVNNAKDTIAGASQWIRNHKTELLASNRPYQMAISAYALARAEEGPDPTAIQLLEKIETLLENQGIMVPPKESGDCMAKPGSGVPKYCKQDSDCNSGDTSKGFYYQEMQCCKVPCEGVKVCSPKPYDSPYMQSGPTEVELHGYALMAYLQLYQKTGAGSTMYMNKANVKKDWLLSMRKGDGFFISTQDTAVALEALARYAIAFPNTIGADFSVRALVNDAFASGTVTVNNDNYIVNHEEKLQVSKPPSKVSLSVLKGTTGTAFVNLVALYNVNSNVSEQAYLIYITSGNADGNSVIRYTFNKNPEFTGSPGTMIVASVSLQSGITFGKLITPHDPTLSPEKQEYDKETNTLNMYYMNGNDNFVNVRSVDIVYKQEYEVKNRQPAVAVVRDYYKQDNNVEVMYSLNQNQNNCLSKNCPTGRAGYVSVNMFLLLIASGMLFCAQFM